MPQGVPWEHDLCLALTCELGHSHAQHALATSTSCFLYGLSSFDICAHITSSWSLIIDFYLHSSSYRVILQVTLENQSFPNRGRLGLPIRREILHGQGSLFLPPSNLGRKANTTQGQALSWPLGPSLVISLASNSLLIHS